MTTCTYPMDEGVCGRRAAVVYRHEDEAYPRCRLHDTSLAQRMAAEYPDWWHREECVQSVTQPQGDSTGVAAA